MKSFSFNLQTNHTDFSVHDETNLQPVEGVDSHFYS